MGDTLWPLGMQTTGLPPFSSQEPEEELGYSQWKQNKENSSQNNMVPKSSLEAFKDTVHNYIISTTTVIILLTRRYWNIIADKRAEWYTLQLHY